MAEVITVPSGIYTASQLITKAGISPADPVTYRAEAPGAAVLRGGDHITKPYVVLKDFLVDARLDVSGKHHGVGARADGVIFEDVTFIGTAVHHGYTYDGTKSCTESANYPGKGPATSVSGPYRSIWRRCDISGNYGAASITNGASAIFDQCYFHNCFNSIGFDNAVLLDIHDSTFWMFPNHGITCNNPNGVLTLTNNLFVIGQNTLNAGGAWTGLKEFYAVNNTIWSPDNVPCADLSGFQVDRVSHVVSATKNVIVTTSKVALDRAKWGGLGQPGLWVSDQNLLWSWTNAKILRADPGTSNGLTLAQWQTLTGQDLLSVWDRPQFVTPIRYQDPLPALGTDDNGWGIVLPSSGAQLRAMFQLTPASPGQGWGIQPGSVAAPAPLQPPVEWRVMQIEAFLRRTAKGFM